MHLPRWTLAGSIALALLGFGCAAGGRGAWDFARGHAEARSAALDGYALPEDPVGRGAALFAFGDFGALDTDALQTVAVPWKVATAALVLAEVGSPEAATPERLPPVLQRFGFLYPERLAGWPGAQPPPRAAGPLGLSRGTARRSVPPIELEIGNLGCAACHAGPGYDARGRPIPSEAWLGSPNTSLDLQAYTEALYAALKPALADQEQLLRAVRTLHPDTSARELATLRTWVLPAARERMAELAAAGDRPLPFPNGAPGLSNGVGALKLQLGLLDPHAGAAEHGFTSIPELSDRTWRSALLADGAYTPAGQIRFRPMAAADRTVAHRDALAEITAFFTVPSMGLTPARARGQTPAVRSVAAFLEARRPQPFPGRIDAASAARGDAIYARACASCHGRYDAEARLASFPNWAGDVGTDPTRARAVTPALVQRIEASAYGSVIDAAATGIYAAPPLTGLWSSAPYLHNGSVPSLTQLVGLEPRAERFQVGGHALDLDRIGIAYPPDHRPWAKPATIDTRAPGLSNRGHEREFAGLTPAEKRDLIEYLKRL